MTAIAMMRAPRVTALSRIAAAREALRDMRKEPIAVGHDYRSECRCSTGCRPIVAVQTKLSRNYRGKPAIVLDEGPTCQTSDFSPATPRPSAPLPRLEPISQGAHSPDLRYQVIAQTGIGTSLKRCSKFIVEAVQ